MSLYWLHRHYTPRIILASRPLFWFYAYSLAHCLYPIVWPDCYGGKSYDCSSNQNCGFRMRRHTGNVFPATEFKGNRQLTIPACITACTWCMSWSLTRGSGENVPGILRACATRNFTHLARGSWHHWRIWEKDSQEFTQILMLQLLSET